MTNEEGDEFPKPKFSLHPNHNDYKFTNDEGGDKEFLINIDSRDSLIPNP